MSVSFKEFMDISFVMLKNLLMDRLVGDHFNFESSSELSLEVLWRVTFRHDTIFDYANSVPNIVCLLYVLSWYKYCTLW